MIFPREFPVKIVFRILLCCLLAMRLTAFGQQANKQDLSALLATAKEAQSNHDFPAAADAYQKAVRLRPDLVVLWANLGLMQEATGDHSGAIESFHRANLLKPSLYVPNLFLGIVYTQTDRPREAIPFLIRAESLNPRDPLAPLSLGRAYVHERDFVAAESAFRRVLAIDAMNSSAWFALGVAAINVVEMRSWELSNEAASSAWAKSLFADALYKQSRVQEAISEEQAVLATDPAFPCAYAQLGFLYLAQRQIDAAREAFNNESDGCSLATLGRARLNLQEGDTSTAIASLRTLWERDQGFLRSNANLIVDGLAADRISAFSAALNQENATAELDASLYSVLSATLQGVPSPIGFALPAGTRSLLLHGSGSLPLGGAQIAEADAHEGRYGQCTADLDERMHQDSARELLLLARCAYMTGDYNRSAMASDLVLSQTPKDSEALYWSVKANEELASAALGRFEQLKPKSERTHLLLGDMYRQRQLYPQAVAEYKAAAALAPRDPAPLFGLASVYNQDSNVDLALATAKAALAINPNDFDLNILVGQILVSQHNWAEAESYLKRGAGAKPEMLPHLHFLLGEIYENTGRMQQAVSELRLALSGDEDGSAYYQLAQIYKQLGERAAAEKALAHVRELQQMRHKRALIVVQDLGDTTQNEAP